MANVELWVPVVSVVSTAVVVALVFFFRYRTRSAMQETIRTALEKGQELTPEIIDRIGHPKQEPRNDLRRGLIWFAVGAGFGAFGLILGEDDAVRPLMAIAAFPFAIGIAYLIMFLAGEKDTST